MARIDDLLAVSLAAVPPKPADDAKRAEKAHYSAQISQGVADAFAEELRQRGLKETTPDPSSQGAAGAERRMAGGIGAKKVDVTWATPRVGIAARGVCQND